MADSIQPSQIDINRSSIITFISLAGFLYGISIGINLTGFSLMFNNLGYNNTDIAYILSFEIMAIFFAAPFLQKIINVLGLFNSIFYSLIIRNLFLLTLSYTEIKFFIILNIFMFGIGGYILFACFQVWVNQITTKGNRGTSFGLLNAAFALGTAFGPVILTVMNVKEGANSIIISSIIATGIILPLNFIRFGAPQTQTPSTIRFYSLLKIAKIPVMCGFIAEYVFHGVGNFIVLYGISVGLSKSESMLLITYMIMSGVLLDVPIGWMIDRINRPLMVIIFTVIVIIAAQLIPYVILNRLQTIITFAVLSSSVSGIYICGISLLGDKFQGSDLIAANSVLSIMNAAGAFSGIAITGIAIDIWGDNGLIISLTLSFAIFLIFNILSLVKR
jgi:MFS family permease